MKGVHVCMPFFAALTSVLRIFFCIFFTFVSHLSSLGHGWEENLARPNFTCFLSRFSLDWVLPEMILTADPRISRFVGLRLFWKMYRPISLEKAVEMSDFWVVVESGFTIDPTVWRKGRQNGSHRHWEGGEGKNRFHRY